MLKRSLYEIVQYLTCFEMKQFSQYEIVFCFDFFPFHVWSKIFPSLIWVFPKSYRSRKKETEEKFFEAEAEKCFRDFLFSTEVTWEKLKSDVEEFWFRSWHGKIIKTECFFPFFRFFCKFEKSKYSQWIKLDTIFHLLGFLVFLDLTPRKIFYSISRRIMRF